MNIRNFNIIIVVTTIVAAGGGTGEKPCPLVPLSPHYGSRCFSFSDRGSLFSNNEPLFPDKERLSNYTSTITLKRTCNFFEYNWIIVLIFRKSFATL